MADYPILVAVVGSSVVAALLTAIFTKSSSDKAVHIENITQERKQWRDRMTKLVIRANKAFHDHEEADLKMIEAEFTVNLNPHDHNDADILINIKELYGEWNAQKLEEFNKRVAFLLKHDWERAKKESTTKISSQTLAVASVFGTILYIPVWFLIDNLQELLTLTDLLKICAGVFILFAVPAFFALFVTYYERSMVSSNKMNLLEIAYFLLNKPLRMKYSRRDSR